MKIILSVFVAVLSSALIAVGIVVGADAALVAALGRDAFSSGGTEAWQLALSAVCLTTLGGNVASVGNVLLGSDVSEV